MFESPQKTAATNIHNEKVQLHCDIANAIHRAMNTYTGKVLVVTLPAEIKYPEVLEQTIGEVRAAGWVAMLTESGNTLIIGGEESRSEILSAVEAAKEALEK